MIIGTKPLLILFLITGLVLIVGSLSHAYGHANLISSDPPQGAVLKSAPERITLTFSEELEPSFSTVYVLDSSQNRVDNGDVVFSKDRRSMSVTLPELKEGVYTVGWRALSAVDGHITAGFFPDHDRKRRPTLPTTARRRLQCSRSPISTNAVGSASQMVHIRFADRPNGEYSISTLNLEAQCSSHKEYRL
jgi:copper transport protein